MNRGEREIKKTVGCSHVGRIIPVPVPVPVAEVEECNLRLSPKLSGKRFRSKARRAPLFVE